MIFALRTRRDDDDAVDERRRTMKRFINEFKVFCIWFTIFTVRTFRDDDDVDDGAG